MKMSIQLGKKIRNLRGEIPQRKFAKKLGISQATLNRIENNPQNITLATLEQVVKSLKCSMDDLFREGD